MRSGLTQAGIWEEEEGLARLAVPFEDVVAGDMLAFEVDGSDDKYGDCRIVSFSVEHQLVLVSLPLEAINRTTGFTMTLLAYQAHLKQQSLPPCGDIRLIPLAPYCRTHWDVYSRSLWWRWTDKDPR